MMSEAAQRREQKDRLSISHFSLRRARHCRTANTHARHRPRNKVTIGPPGNVAHYRIQHLDPQTPHFCLRDRSDVDPQIVKRCHWRIRNASTLQVRALDDNNSRNRARARQHSDPLSFMKLDPQRMLASGSGLAQPQVTVVSDFSDSKAGTIERTRNYASRTTATFAQYKISQRVTFPARHCLHD